MSALPKYSLQGDIVAGIDVGSVAAKVVLYDTMEKAIISTSVVPTGWAPQESATLGLQHACTQMQLDVRDITYSVGTGYGRIALPFTQKTVTEISCHAKAATYMYPDVGIVLDIGGQDSKAIAVEKDGSVLDFVMNDKCAAGTGRFLQVLAGILGVSLEELGVMASTGKPVSISSMCAVFAESEIVGLLAQGVKPQDVAAGVFVSIAKRMRGLSGRIAWKGKGIFTGGLATSSAFAAILSQELGIEMLVPPHAQCMGALGAALFAADTIEKL